MDDDVPKRKPGRPPGSKNKTTIEESQEEKQPVGRPSGSKNKKGTKPPPKPTGKLSYADLYMNATGAAKGSGTILELLALLEASQKQWTDERILQYFSKDDFEDSVCEMENSCHVYSSSKGRLIAESNTLPSCKLFPGVELSSKFLDHYIHTFDDVLSYGDFVSKTCQTLQMRAKKLLTRS